MKIAIYCTGFLRSFKTNAVNLRKALLDKFDCDLYFYTISNEFECDSYFNENSAFEYIQKELKPKVFIYEKEDLNQPITTRIRRMWFKVKFINDMRNDIEKRDNFRYDLIIRMRPDILLTDIEKLEKYILCFSGEKLLLPKFDSKSYPSLCIDNFKGYNDQFAIGCQSLIDIYCSLFDYISDYNKQGVLNSSSLLKYHLDRFNIEPDFIDNIYKLVQKENKIITIAGDSGSGKTTLAKMLKKSLDSCSLIFECDRYHKWERGDENWKQYTHLHPNANNLEECANDVTLLKANHEIYQRDYDHDKGKFTDLESIRPLPIIIVIGLHTLFDENLNRISDLKIYLDPDESVKTEWKIDRDKTERGYSELQVKSQIEKRKPFYKEYIFPQKEKADIILSFNESYKFAYKGTNNTFLTLEEVCKKIISLI